jgi:hypothetical protein
MAGVQSVTALLGGRHVVEKFVFYLDDAISKAMTMLFLIFVLRLVVRSSGVAAGLSAAILTFVAISWTPPGATETNSGNPVVLVVIIGAATALVISALTRSGLLTTVTAILTLSILTEFPVSSNASSWYFGTAITGIVAVLGMAAYGYHTAVAGKTWLGDIILKN